MLSANQIALKLYKHAKGESYGYSMQNIPLLADLCENAKPNSKCICWHCLSKLFAINKEHLSVSSQQQQS